MQRLIRILGICAALLLLAPPAMAGPVGAAKDAGQLGEAPDGYLHVVSSEANPETSTEAKAEAKALAADINAKRRAKYQSIAAKEGVSVGAVAKQAGKRLVGSAPPGQYVMGGAGKWMQK